MTDFFNQSETLKKWAFTPQIPVLYAKTILNCARNRNLNVDELLRLSGLNSEALKDPTARVLPVAHVNLISLVLEQSGNNGLGFDVGYALPLTSHGDLGFAVMCASTMLEVCEILQRFWNLQERSVNLVTQTFPSQTTITLSTPLKLDSRLHSIHFECLLTIIFRSVQMLLGTDKKIGQMSLCGPEPDYLNRFIDKLPPLQYEMNHWQYKIPGELMDKPLPMSNPEMLALAIQRCEREMELMSDQSSHFLTRAEQTIVLGSSGYPSQEEMAHQLNVSVRTMRRKFMECGTTYRELLERVRRRDAICLLETSNLKIQSIAMRLGYVSSGNFTRAFKSWTGQSPQAFRENLAIRAQSSL